MPNEEERSPVAHGVYIANGKYHCADCHHEMELEEACPVCKKDFDWAKIKASIPPTW